MIYRDFNKWYFDFAIVENYIGFDFWRAKKILETVFKAELGFIRITIILKKYKETK